MIVSFDISTIISECTNLGSVRYAFVYILIESTQVF